MNIFDIAKKINAKYYGEEKNISNISNTSNLNESCIVLALTQNNIKDIPTDFRGVILTSKQIASNHGFMNTLVSKEPKVSFAILMNLFSVTNLNKPKLTSINGCDLSCGENVFFGKNPSFGVNVVIENDVEIGDFVKIGHSVIIHNGVKIGNNVTINSGTIIGSEGFGNALGRDHTWHHIAHLGSVVIGNNVSIGSNCTIDRGTIENTVISNNVILDNQIHIAHNVFIGENTAIAAKVGIAGSCNIGKRNMIGGMVGIVDHIKTVDDVIISATSTVNKDLKEPGIYTGIMPISNHNNWKRIAFWITKLDKIVRKFNIKKI